MTRVRAYVREKGYGTKNGNWWGLDLVWKYGHDIGGGSCTDGFVLVAVLRD